MKRLISKLVLDVESFRYENKFLLENANYDEVDMVIRLNSAGFREVFHQRTINNIYLDSDELLSFKESVEGEAQRFKARVRWYGAMFGLVENPMLEIKYKKNNVVGKIAYPVKRFTFDKKFSKWTWRHLLGADHLPPMLTTFLKGLKISLINSYDRTYYLSSDKKYRLTFDQKCRFYNPDGIVDRSLSEYKERNNYILELKYPVSCVDKASRITSQIPYRITKSSKYVTGIRRIYNF